MNSETLLELLRHQPFEPFTVFLTNGDSFQVRHPDQAIVLKTRLVVGDPETDRLQICALLHIARIESHQAA